MAKDDFISLAQSRTKLVQEEYCVPQAKCGSRGEAWGSARVGVVYVVDTSHITKGLKESRCGMRANYVHVDDDALQRILMRLREQLIEEKHGMKQSGLGCNVRSRFV